MGETTGIEWADATWNPLVGCEKVSPGCDHCYAETFVNRFSGSKGFPLPFDQIHIRDDRFLLQPLNKWKEPKKIFVNSLSDLFHKDVPEEFIAKVFAVMAAAHWHRFELLTKRHGRMKSLLNSMAFRQEVGRQGDLLGRWGVALTQWPLPNVWLGVSVEDQERAALRIPALLATPAAVHWLSMEPLLGGVDLENVEAPNGAVIDALHGDVKTKAGEIYAACPASIRWVVVGGESGAGARPMNVEWARSLRDQCVNAGVPFLFKQWGSHDENGVHMSKKLAGRTLDGRTWDEYPEVLQVA